MSRELAVDVLIAVSVYACAWAVAFWLSRRVASIARELRVDGQQRMLTLDGLRGVLALGVFSHHVFVTRRYFETGEWGPPEIPFAEELGQGSVMLFFMITAFLFWGRLLDAGPRMQWGRFFISRVFRLAPLYWLVVVVLVIIAFAHSDWELNLRLRDEAVAIADWFGFTIRRVSNINNFLQTGMVIAGVTWSLRYEWAFYFALPLVGFVFTKARHWGAAAASAGLIGAFWWLVRDDAYNAILPKLFAPFLGGIVAAYWVRSPRLREFGASRAYGVAALVALAYVVFFRRMALNPISLAGLSMFFAAVVCDNPLLSGLRHSAARWLGEISYGVYLIHGMLLWVVTRNLAPMLGVTMKSIHPSWWILMPLALTPILVGLTSLLNLVVERPGIEWGRRLGQRIASTPRRREQLAAVTTENVAP